MLTAPLASTAGWEWTLDAATDLPQALRGAFPATTSGAAGATEPVVTPEAVIGNSAILTGLLFPFTGHYGHNKDGDVHWIWGRAADPARYPALRTALQSGNPLIALRFTNATAADPDAFPSEGRTRGDAVALTGGSGVTVQNLTVVAAYPLEPGLDTLSVLRDLRTRIATALADGDDLAAEAAAWSGFVDALDILDAPLRLLQPSGSPENGRTVSVAHAGGDVTAALAEAHRGDVLAATGLDRGDLGVGSSLTVDLTDEEGTAIAPGAAATSGPVALDGSASHVDFAVLEEWFASQGSAELERYNRGCTVTPFINGPEYFDHLFTELHATTLPAPAGSPQPVLYLTGYSIDNSTKFASEASGLENRTLEEVTSMLADGGAEARFLALQFLQLEESFTNAIETGALITSLLLAIAGGTATFFQDSASWEQVSFFGHSQALAAALFFAAGSLNDILDKLEPNKSAIDALDDLAGVEAHLDPYPAECPDNPLCASANDIVKLAHEAQKRFNAFHQKIAVVRNDEGLHAYCGGIDLNANRLDDRDHGKRGPYHDVHARVDGPAAGELAKTFTERWAERTEGATLALDAPGAFSSLPTNGSDIVQIARTYFGPDPVDNSRAFSFAPTGERTILDTSLAAIARARRYIYIEDQYLTPPLEYSSALISAAAHVSGPLIIVIPETPDQPFGFEARQRFVSDLSVAWGDRLKVGAMRGRFSRSQTNRKTAVGRLWLTDDLAEGGNQVDVGPPDRVPETPFWLIVDNEAMRVVGKAAGTGTQESVRLNVDRAGTTNLFDAGKGTTRTTHKAGTPATAGIFAGIYVHSKLMLIDDCFASIGSANCNRRGYYSDGECNIFALREELTHGENWIRTFRTRLWSELAGVPEEYGAVAFADPTRNLNLFERKFLTGNRFSPFAAQPYSAAFEVQTDFTGSTSALAGVGFILKAAAGMGQIIAGTESEDLFDTFIDPSSEVAL